MSAEDRDLRRFLAGQVAACDLPHREHVRMAFATLHRHEFDEALLLFCRALRALTANAGRPQAFNLTVTLAFLALIAERMEADGEDFGAFADRNADLFDKNLLARWYRPERLSCALARRIFLLPDPLD